MNWWEETEQKAHRAKSPASLALAVHQRLTAAGMHADLSQVPAYDLAKLYELAVDYIKLIESVLVIADGDMAALRRQAMLLDRWARQVEFWVATSGAGFNQLMNSLDLDTAALAGREELQQDDGAQRPEEQGKLDGRYRNWHLLYERLDLKLASLGLPEETYRGLARCLARLYEECLITIRVIGGLEKEARPRFGALARLLLDINTTWHFDLGPHHIGHGEMGVRPGVSKGLRLWLALAFG